MSEEITEEATTGKRKGPKPNPFARYARARAKADKARRAYEKVQNVAEALAEAEAEEQAALAALEAEYENAVSGPVEDDGDE